MINLLALTEQAKALGRGEGLNAEQEVARQMQVCNACRYCVSFCATFSAMTRRLSFADADIHYLANLCHNCKGCWHACQYARSSPSSCGESGTRRSLAPFPCTTCSSIRALSM